MTHVVSLAILTAGGLVAGVAITLALMRRSALDKAEARFELWRTAGLRQMRQAAVDEGRAVVKQRLSDVLAVDMEPIPFTGADVRFVGHPVHYVVFDGHTEVKDGDASQLREVVFVSLVQRGRTSSPFSRLVEECVAKGRVAWMTLSVPSTA